MKHFYLLLATVFFSLNIHSQNAPFITTWKVPPGNFNIIIPTSGTGYNYTIDFGDGTVQNNVTGNATHVYSSAGIYTVSITGDFPRIRFSGSFVEGRIMSVEQWGDIEWQSMELAFWGCLELVINAVDAPDLSQVTNMSQMFKDARSFNQNIDHWDVSGVTDMSGMFADATLFNQPLNNWDVSNVTDMQSMFAGAKSFNQPIDNWDVSNVTDMQSMFAGNDAFNEPLNSWDVSNVNNMSWMFISTGAFNQPLSNWDVSNVTNMSQMFGNTLSFNQNINSWDVSNVTDMSSMFSRSRAFNEPLDSWDVSNVTDMSSMFGSNNSQSGVSFNQPIGSWDVSSVTNMHRMFTYASNFNQPVNGWDVSSVADMSYMFSEANNFNQPLNSWDVSSVTTMSRMFSGNKFGNKMTFNQPLGNWDVSNVTNMTFMFANLSDFDQPLNNWDVSNVTDMRGMFTGAIAFNQPLNGWNVSSVTFMGTSGWNGMFEGATKFNQPLNNWNVSNVTNLTAMFKNAQNFNQDLSNWNFNAAVNLSGFLDDSGLDKTNYDLLLAQFDILNLQNLSLGAKGILYCNAAIRGNLINVGWTINGDGHLVNCNQSFTPDAFVTRWNVKSNDLTIETPVGGLGYNYSVDFGDGTTQNNVTYQIAHTYSQPGVYNMTITGNFPRIAVRDFDYNKLWNVEQWGNIQWQSMEEAFYQCSNVKINAMDAPDLSQVTNMNLMFFGASSFNQPINHWDVSNVTSMQSLFSNATSFNQHIDTWDTSNVTNMNLMFFGASSFNQPINNWDVSSVNSMAYMFSGAASFNQPIDSWNVSGVTTMRNMFSYAHSFNQLLNNWNVSNVTNMERMFGGASSSASGIFNQPLNNWDVSSVTDMRNMFHGAVEFNQDISSWDVSNVIHIVEMFYNASTFNQPLNNWDVSSVTSMNGLFRGADSFNQPLDSWDTSGVTDMSGMFLSATSFDQPLNNWDVSNVTNMTTMWLSATSFNQPLNNWNVSNVTNMRSMFSGATSFNQSLNNWNVSSVNNMIQMFYGATSFNQPINNWNVSSVTSMREMFYSATAFNQPLNNWSVSNVTDMDRMFQEASSFNQPLFNWNVSNVTGMRNMFYKATKFNKNLSSWNFNPSVILHGSSFGGGGWRFLSETSMDISNYDILLARFVQLGLQNKLLGAHDLYFCNENDHNYLITTLGWAINGDNLSPDCNYIQGTILFDQNNNGCDPNDIAVEDFMVTATDGTNDYSTFSNNGVYNLGVMGSSFTVSVVNAPSYFSVNPASANVTFLGNNTEVLDFCVTANQSSEDLNITLLPTSEARPGFEADYRLVIKNVGTETIANVTATLDFDDSMQQFVSANPAPGTTTTNTLTFPIGTMQPFQSFEVDIAMLSFQPPTVEGGDILNFIAEVTPNGNDHTPNDNIYNLAQVVVNSYDPNDKQVLQGEELHIDDANEYLDYLIRFQNMGTASAIHVRILDTLHSKLDWSTFTPISASHDYYIKITEGNRVEFMFDNIHLPHEDDDEPASHGFVAYKIKPKSNVQVGDVISGDAAIYFDFNAPIITNMVHTQIVDPLSLADNPNPLNQIAIYPNPTNKTLNIFLTDNIQLEEVKIYDLQGKEVQKFQGKEKTLDVENLSRGMYFLKITTDRGVVNRKFVKD